MPFTSCGGCLKDIFITEAEIIDRYVGNQLWLWGQNCTASLGTNASGSAASRSSPVQTVSATTNWREVSIGGPGVDGGNVAAIKTDGSLWTWGSGACGQLGNNSQASRSSPVQTVSGGTNWKQAVTSGRSMSAIKTDGTLWSWGSNMCGGLGTDPAVASAISSPVQTVAGGNNWKQVARPSVITGNFGVESNPAAAIKTDGTLWMWGNNLCGILGINAAGDDTLICFSPVQTVAGGNNWKQVALGEAHAAAVKTDGTLWIWGSNMCGMLGTNISTCAANRSSPVQTVSGGTNWKQVSLGLCFSAAIKNDGTLWTWGDGTSGRLGNNSVLLRSSPVQTVSGGTNWKQVSAGCGHTSAIKTDGTLWIWGAGAAGSLGNNLAVSTSSPIQTVSGGTNWKQTSVGSFVSAAVTHTEL